MHSDSSSVNGRSQPIKKAITTFMAVNTFLKLAGFTHTLRYADMSHQALSQMQTPTGGGMTSQYPPGFGRWLQALAYALSGPQEIAIVGDPGSVDTQALLSVARGSYQPIQVSALGAPYGQPSVAPLLQDRGLIKGQAAAYVCHDFMCQTSVSESEKLQAQLGPR